MSRPQQQQRVVADGWGRQASGSVFCADSSLRYIFESQMEPPPPGTTAAAITSLASGEFDSSTIKDTAFGGNAQRNKSSLGYSTSYDKLTSNPQRSWGSLSTPVHSSVAKLDGSVHSGRGVDGVDLFEAQIARACAQITKQTPTLPHSFRECSVCLTQNAHAQITVCGHTFHSKCFLRWFRMNRSCPLCRGPVDAVQLAPVLSVQDELEAIMAEMEDDDEDHEPLPVVDPLMTNPDLISFLGEGFDDADMEMMALEGLEAVPLDKHHHIHHHGHLGECQPQEGEEEDDDASMDDEDDGDEQQHQQHVAMPPVMAMPPQFAPTSTMPNYWNVLNQGLTMPSVVPQPTLMPAPSHQTHHHHMNLQHQQQSQSNASRVVPIAPKPLDGQFHAHHRHPHQHKYGHTHPFATNAPRAVSPAAALSVASSTCSTPAAPRVVSCRCTGGCRNGRCACVKEGGMCGVSCRCTSCKNPFLMVKAAGADIDALLQDACFMHNVSKTRDMVQRMQEPVEVPCCGTTRTVLDCVQGFTCTPCARVFDFSWCMNKLLDHDKTPRNHCEICKRCCDHRDVHCNDCGRCYFAGVAASLPCPCKESSRKRRDHATNASSNDLTAMKDEASGAADAEDKDGECVIM